MAAPALTFDITNWAELDRYNASNQVSNALQQKGFCFIKGGLEPKARLGAQREARALRKTNVLERVPREAASSLFGETASCWTHELAHPGEEPPDAECCLRQVDKCLHDLGDCIACSSANFFGMVLEGRAIGVLHHSRMPEDRAAPQLIEPDEAVEYIHKAIVRKVMLFYYLGPSAAKLSITPREDPDRVYEVTMKSDTIVVFRNDVCLLSYATRGFAASVQVDFLARRRAGLQEAPKDLLPPPEELADWYEERLRDVVEDDIAVDSLPLEFVREAKMSFYKKTPMRIVQLWHELPTMPYDFGNAPFEATCIGGQDPIMQVLEPGETHTEKRLLVKNFGNARWDISEYYDEDTQNAVNFKVYTKHLGVVNRLLEEYDLGDFGINKAEALSFDQRARMLLEAQQTVLHNSNLDRSDTKDKNVGFFFAMCGQDQSMLFMTKQPKISKYTLTGQSNSALVSRMSYHWNCRGPTLVVDTDDSSGLAAMNMAVDHLREDRCGPFACVASASHIGSPLELIMQCASLQISKSGRSRVFDDSCDGFSKGEGVAAFVLEPHDSEARTEKHREMRMPGERRYRPVGIRALITGSALNSRGQSTSLSAPNGPGLRDVVEKAARSAELPFSIVDAVEVNASGSPLADMVELGVLRELLRTPEGRDFQAVPLRPMKAHLGNLGAPNGLASVARACLLIEKGLHGPTVHLRQELENLWDEDDQQAIRRLHVLTEAVEAKSHSQFVGVSSFGSTGTNVHQVLFWEVPEQRRRPAESKPITWWPGGEQKEVKPPVRGYYIIGTWTAWHHCQLMEEEEEGVFGYTLTMGENNWECFQVWLDEDSDQVLHPTEVRAPREAKLVGPDSDIGRSLCWYISGKLEPIRLINEVQSLGLQQRAEQARLDGAEPPAPPEPRCVVAFQSDYRPPGHEDALDEAQMPVVNLSASDGGRPGDRYRIRLHVRGRYKRLEWSKATGADALTLPGEAPYRHVYQIIGDHSYWTFAPMEPDGSEPGLYTAEIQLLKERSNFQILRNGDWEQGFYPAATSSEPGAEILGPDECGQGKNWQIHGRLGDFFRVQFRRKIVNGQDVRAISWEYTRHEEVDFEELAKSHRYYLAGSWTDFKKLQELEYNEADGDYQAQIKFGRTEQESFQILLNRNWLAAVHPSFNDATMHDDGHRLEGPDDDGAGRNWTIGLDPRDGVAPGCLVVIHLSVQGGLPRRVWWQARETPDPHRQYLMEGCMRAFERHKQLMGFEGELMSEKKTRIIRKVEFK